MTAEELKDFHQRVDAGIKAAVAKALEEHRRMGRSIVIERDGKIVTIPPEEIPPLVEQMPPAVK